MFKINNLWGFVGATLVMVLVFLLLTNYKAAQSLFRSGTRSYAGLLGVLQGRTFAGVLK